MNIVTMHTQQQATIAEGTAAAAAGDKGQSGLFVHTLGQVLSLDGQEQSSSGQLFMQLPIAVLLPNVLQLAEETQASGDMAALLAALQAANSSELAALQQQPAVRQWVQQVEELSARMLPETPLSQTPVGHASVTAEAQAAPDKSPIDSLLAAIGKFQRLLDTNPQQAPVQALGNQLSALLSELSAVAPAASQTTKGESASSQSTQLSADKQIGMSALLSALRQPEGAKPLSAGPMLQPNAEQTGAQLLMNKLAYLKPTMHAAMTQQPVAEALVHVAGSTEQSAQPTAQPIADTQSAAAASAQQVKVAEQPIVLGAEAKPAPAYTMNAHRFADEMSGLLIKNMKISQLGGVSEAKITLMPEHLGQLNLKIAVHNGQLTAHFAAESLYARDLLEAQLPQLRAALQLQGLQVDRLEVTTQQAAQTGAFQEQQQSFKQSGQHNGQTGGTGQRGESDFAAEIEQAEQTSRIMYGSTFIASA